MGDERCDQANRQPTDGARGVGVKGRGGGCGRQRRGGGRAPRCFPCATDHPIRHPPAALARGGLAPMGGMSDLGYALRREEMARAPARRARPCRGGQGTECPPPCRRRRWRSTRPRAHRRGGEGGRRSFPPTGGKDVTSTAHQSVQAAHHVEISMASAPAPRRGRPLPPSGGYWRRRVAVGWWPIRGARGGARKRRAPRRYARAHAAADSGPPSPTRRRRRWRPTHMRTR